MEVLVAAAVVLAVAYVVLHEISTADRPARTPPARVLPAAPPPVAPAAPPPVAPAAPPAELPVQSALPAAPPVRPPVVPVVPVVPVAPVVAVQPAWQPVSERIPERVPAPVIEPWSEPSRPRRDAPGDTTSVLGALGPTEPDRRVRPLRRTASALALMMITLVIASGVGGAIYLGLRRLG